ncbi:MAG: winged helix-turn-helix transcriptional regulator [Promethearchaeota archaeon]
MNKKNAIDHEFVILECIRDNPGGVTASDIANITKFSRNTVSKYVRSLEVTNQIFSKKVGAYKLYFAMEKRYIPFETAISYYKALLSKIKKFFPDTEEMAKKVGREAVREIKFAFGPNIYKQLKSLKEHPISRLHLESFKNFYSAYDIFQPSVDISILKIDQAGKSATYRFKNSVFLEDSDDYAYHIHIMCGITEGILNRVLKTEVLCEIDQIYVSDNKEESFFDITIKIE